MSKRIAVLGGGLTGLSAAFHLSRRFPDSAIRVFEQSPRVGGWVRTERVTVSNERGDKAQMTLETGPRTVRPNSRAVLELVHLLGLKDALVTVPKTAPAAQDRFLYLPGQPTIERIPSTLRSLLKSPLRSTLVSAVASEPFRRRNRPEGAHDESVDSFLSRRFGKSFAQTFGSALVHGIYAADSRNISIRAAFPTMWQAEERGKGSLVRGFLWPSKPPPPPDHNLGAVADLMNGVSVFSFKDGMSTLTDALHSHLDSHPNIAFDYDTGVESITDTRVRLSTQEQYDATHIVSTLPLHVLHPILPTIPHLDANPTSTVTVINFVFPVPPSELHPAGFGYLIPRPEAGYSDASPGMLGVIFDSCSLSSQDSPSSSAFTKLTVMLGGPHPRVADVDEVLVNLEKQLGGKPLPNPVWVKAHQQTRCIPTLMPGHVDRMEEMKATVRERWGGRLEVIGAGVGGVSLNDCVEAGRNVGKDW